MTPKDLTDRFEHISGSEMHRKQYHDLEAQKLKAEEQTSFLFSKRKTVTQEKKQKKEQKDEAEKHVKLQQELVSHDSTPLACLTDHFAHAPHTVLSCVAQHQQHHGPDKCPLVVCFAWLAGGALSTH